MTHELSSDAVFVLSKADELDAELDVVAILGQMLPQNGFIVPLSDRTGSSL